MVILINFANRTPQVNRDSVNIRYYGPMRSDCSFVLEFNKQNPYALNAGMEVRILNDDDTLLWCGIAERITYKYRSGNFISVLVFCRGYEAVVSHKVITSYSGTYRNAKAALQYIYSAVLQPEGIISGNDSFPSIDLPVTVDYPGAVSAEEALDFISNYYGVVWWIDKDKVFRCCEGFKVKTTPFSVNLGGTFDWGISEISVAESVENYRNVQYIALKDNQYSVATDTEGMSAMRNFFGTGDYSRITKNSRVEDLNYGNGLAKKILNNYGGVPKYIRFVSENGDFSLFDRISVYGGFVGESSENYVLTSVNVSFKYGKKISAVIGMYFNGNNYIPLINQMKNISFNI